MMSDGMQAALVAEKAIVESRPADQQATRLASGIEHYATRFPPVVWFKRGPS